MPEASAAPNPSGPAETGSAAAGPAETGPAETAPAGATSAAGRAAGGPRSPRTRRLTPGVSMLAVVVGVNSLFVGGLLVAVSLTGHVFGAWPSPLSLSPGLIGAAMLGTAPALFSVVGTPRWEEARTLLLPTGVALVGLFAVTLLNVQGLYIAEGGPAVGVLFSLGWLFVLGGMCVGGVAALGRQLFVRAEPSEAAREPIPGWSKPMLGLLGAAWLSTGVVLLAAPGLRDELVPWETGRLDAQSLGVWGIVLGLGIVGALAEGDLNRSRVSLLALPGTAAAMALVLICRAGDVDWSHPSATLFALMVAGLFSAGIVGRILQKRSETGR